MCDGPATTLRKRTVNGRIARVGYAYRWSCTTSARPPSTPPILPSATLNRIPIVLVQRSIRSEIKTLHVRSKVWKTILLSITASTGLTRTTRALVVAVVGGCPKINGGELVYQFESSRRPTIDWPRSILRISERYRVGIPVNSIELVARSAVLVSLLTPAAISVRSYVPNGIVVA